MSITAARAVEQPPTSAVAPTAQQNQIPFDEADPWHDGRLEIIPPSGDLKIAEENDLCLHLRSPEPAKVYTDQMTFYLDGTPSHNEIHGG